MPTSEGLWGGWRPRDTDVPFFGWKSTPFQKHIFFYFVFKTDARCQHWSVPEEADAREVPAILCFLHASSLLTTPHGRELWFPQSNRQQPYVKDRTGLGGPSPRIFVLCAFWHKSFYKSLQHVLLSWKSSRTHKHTFAAFSKKALSDQIRKFLHRRVRKTLWKKGDKTLRRSACYLQWQSSICWCCNSLNER